MMKARAVISAMKTGRPREDLLPAFAPARERTFAGFTEENRGCVGSGQRHVRVERGHG